MVHHVAETCGMWKVWTTSMQEIWREWNVSHVGVRTFLLFPFGNLPMVSFRTSADLWQGKSMGGSGPTDFSVQSAHRNLKWSPWFSLLRAVIMFSRSWGAKSVTFFLISKPLVACAENILCYQDHFTFEDDAPHDNRHSFSRQEIHVEKRHNRQKYKSDFSQ